MAGIALSIVGILMIFRVLGPRPSMIAGIIGLCIDLIAAMAIIFGMIYIGTAAQQAYTINAFSQQLTVSNSTINTTAFGSNNAVGGIGFAFIFIDFILGFAYFFLATFIYRDGRKEKKYKSG